MKNCLIYHLGEHQSVDHLLDKWLRQYGEVIHFSDSNKFVEEYYSNPPHLCIVYFSMAMKLEAAFLLRKMLKTHIPILVLSDTEDHYLQIEALKNGAVDVISLPLNRDEVILKVRNLLNLYKNLNTDENESYSLNESKQCIMISEEQSQIEIQLTKKEFLICKKLFQHRDANVSREEITLYLENHQGNEANSDRVIDYHICNIKKKLGSHKSIIKPIYGIGYRLVS